MKIHKIASHFAPIANRVLNDETLSWKAKGLYAYIYAKPDGWDFAMTRAARESKDGRDATLKAMKELEDARYIIRKKLKTGRMEYVIGVEPITENPDLGMEKPSPEKPKVGKAVVRKTRPISNTDVLSNTENKKDSSDSGESQGIVEVIKAFEPVHLQAASWYGNTTQRKAAGQLIAKLGLEKTLELVRAIPNLMTIPYCPQSITTPDQLAKNLTKLAAFTQQQRSRAAKFTVQSV